MKTVLLLIRHAESTWNAQGRWQGHGDPPLSMRGREQAEALGEPLASERPGLLITSDLARAVETASLVGERLGLPPHTDPRLRELDIGSWTGLTRAEIEVESAEALARFEAGDPDARPGGGESRRELRARVRRAVAGIAADNPGCCIALVTHLGVIRALLPESEIDNADWRRLDGDRIPELE